MAEYAKPDVLVSTDWLEEHLDDPAVRAIEVDEDTEAYEKGHVRGAVGLELDDRPALEGRQGLSGIRPASRSCCRPPASVRTRRSCCTAGTTTGSPPTRTGS